MLIHLASRVGPSSGRSGGGVWGTDVAIDYRETAPTAITRDVFLDEKGEADPKKSRDSALGVGVPGTVAGLALAHEKYGSGKFTLALCLRLQRGCGVRGWGRDGLGAGGAGKGREGAEGVDVDYALDVGNVSTARATSLGAPY
jgi:hypothetical protein